MKTDEEPKKTDEEPKKTDEEPKKKPSGIPLICGSLNWDLMGREKSRVNSSMKNIFPCLSGAHFLILLGLSSWQVSIFPGRSSNNLHAVFFLAATAVQTPFKVTHYALLTRD